MRKTTVAARLGFGFACVVALLIAVAGIGMSRLGQLDEATRLIAKDRWVKAQIAGDILYHTSQIAISLRNMMLTDSRDDMAQQKERILGSRKVIADGVATVRPMVTLPRGKELLAAVERERVRYIDGQEKLIALIESGASEPARQFLNQELRPILRNYQDSLVAFRDFQTELVGHASQSASETYENARNLTIAAVVLSLLFAGSLSFWIIRSVTGPLGGEPEEAKAVVERIALGDLRSDIRVKAGDDVSLMAATGRMQGNLRRMLSDLKTNSENVAGEAHHLAEGASQVATATEEQSSAAGAMAAAVEEMNVSINHVSDSAREAHTVTAETGGMSQSGNRIIEDMVADMKGISDTVSQAAVTIQAMGDRSQEISSIVRVIKEVAEQTNLLALNAAIEAARAGEQGRGFAVVADEVRKLAERTAKATTEISSMIDGVQNSAQAAVTTMQQAVSRVEHGVGMAQKANDSMLGISDGAQRVVSAVNDISHALKEQSVASNEIAANVERIAQMAEENSAATRATADSARRLETLAADTRQTVSYFQI